jgi:hypothetical protein
MYCVVGDERGGKKRKGISDGIQRKGTGQEKKKGMEQQRQLFFFFFYFILFRTQKQ